LIVKSAERTDVRAAEYVNELSTRQRQVPFQLLPGDSVKQIATKLSLSNYTVNDHLKHIYRRFGVSGHGELLAQFPSGGQIGRSDSPA
jgi:DNA-binding NarL/FixJ family response regulator